MKIERTLQQHRIKFFFLMKWHEQHMSIGHRMSIMKICHRGGTVETQIISCKVGRNNCWLQRAFGSVLSADSSSRMNGPFSSRPKRTFVTVHSGGRGVISWVSYLGLSGCVDIRPGQYSLSASHGSFALVAAFIWFLPSPQVLLCRLVFSFSSPLVGAFLRADFVTSGFLVSVSVYVTVAIVLLSSSSSSSAFVALVHRTLNDLCLRKNGSRERSMPCGAGLHTTTGDNG